MRYKIKNIAGMIMFAAMAILPRLCFAQPVQKLPKEWKSGTVVPVETVRRTGLEQWFVQQPIPDAVFARMQGKSYPVGCTVPRSSLRYLKVLHDDGKGNIRMGEMVCNKSITDDLLSIFKGQPLLPILINLRSPILYEVAYLTAE